MTGESTPADTPEGETATQIAAPISHAGRSTEAGGHRIKDVNAGGLEETLTARENSKAGGIPALDGASQKDSTSDF